MPWCSPVWLSWLSERPLQRRFKAGGEAKEGRRGDATLYEPDREEILTRLLPLYLRSALLQAYLENVCSEQVARRNAMSNATENAVGLLLSDA